MAKRRSLATSEEADDPDTRGRPRSREDRRRLARSKKPKDGPAWRKAVIPGGVAAAIIVVVLLVIWGTGHLFQAPCLTLTPIPASSGPSPLFPPANTTDFSRTWCPGDTAVLLAYPSVVITVNGQTVALPSSIGRSSNFTDYTCDLPIETQPASAGLGANIVEINSPWEYEYTLGDLFAVWGDSYTSARVNATYTTTTIDYTSTQLLGLPINSAHTVTLFVDNQPDNDGPNLDLSTTSYLSSVYPSCISSVYGTGHTIVIQYKPASGGAATPGVRGPVASTVDMGIGLVGLEYGAPMPRVALTSAHAEGLAADHAASFAWLSLRLVD